MKLLIASILISGPLSAWAAQPSCTIFTLGTGVKNYTRYAKTVELKESPSGQSQIGKAVLEMPEWVPLEDNQKPGAPVSYKLEMELKFQEDTSKWVIGGSSLTGSFTVYKDDKLLTYAEANSNTLHNESDKRVIEGEKVLAINTKIYSPIVRQKIKEMEDKEIKVLGVELTVGELITELGMQNGVEHLAAQGLLKPSELAVLQINCSKE